LVIVNHHYLYRVGYIVGNAGWLGAVLLLLLAYGILLITVFSISAIATNGQIKAGGVYFMISR
jgi:potassium/chloride transporter 9